MLRQSEDGVRWSSYAARRSDQLLIADTRGGRFDDVRVRVRCFGRDNERSVVLASGAAICDAEDIGVLYAGDGRQPGGFQASQHLLSSNRLTNRHIDRKYHFIRDALLADKSTCVYVESEDKHADVLTKALERNTFETHVTFLMMGADVVPKIFPGPSVTTAGTFNMPTSYQ